MMGSSPVANPVCWGSIIAIPLNLTIPGQLDRLCAEKLRPQLHVGIDVSHEEMMVAHGNGAFLGSGELGPSVGVGSE